MCISACRHDTNLSKCASCRGFIYFLHFKSSSILARLACGSDPSGSLAGLGARVGREVYCYTPTLCSNIRRNGLICIPSLPLISMPYVHPFRVLNVFLFCPFLPMGLHYPLLYTTLKARRTRRVHERATRRRREFPLLIVSCGRLLCERGFE